MIHRHILNVLLISMAFLSLSIPSFSQDRALLARADSLHQLGRDLFAEEKYEAAIDLFEEAAVIRKEQLGDYSADLANSINNIGVCYQNLGDYSKALNYHQQSLEIRERVLGKEHPDYAKSLDNVASCYSDLGDYAKALEYRLQALEIREKVLGKEHPDYQALEIREKVLGKEHPDYASSLSNVASHYSRLGDYAKALEYHQQALAIREKLYGKEHSSYATSLNNIGNCFGHLGDYAKALEYALQALEIREKVLGKEHPSYARSLNYVAVYYSRLGDYAKALEYGLQALEILEKVLGKEHPDYALSLNNVANRYSYLSDYAKALEYGLQALEIREKVLGKEHPSYASSLNNVANRYSDLGDYAKAAECFTAYSSLAGDIVTRTFSSLTESQRESFWKKYNYFYTNRLYDYSATISSPQMNMAAYDGALLGKGLLLNAETEMRKLILESGDEDALQMYNEMQQSRIRLDKIYENPVGKKVLIDSLNNDIETRQQELMKRSKVFGDYTRNLALKWTDVQATLGKKDIAIEFETYTHKDTTFYIALTLRPGYTEPHLVELFNSKELDGLKPRDYGKTPFSNRIYQSPRMTGLVWGKLEEELRGTENVYFSPAGELHNIGIEYFLDEDGEHLLSEKRNYYRLTSTRELAKEYRAHKMADATVYGGIDYNVTPGTKLTGNETESERLALAAARSYMLDSLSVKRGGGDVWTYLEGSEKEARAVSSTLTSMRVRNELLDGEMGTEESFKALSGAKKDVIHISTHGFYYQSEKDAGHDHVDVSSFMLGDESTAPKEDKALTRSGLLFAGANNTFAGKEIPLDVEDGVLTAKDISRMDLRGTDLVVLSACQTGLGEVSGDGVFGLQRGFKKAGVQSIVMSLWEVDDTATKVMMTRFYENLAKGKGKFDSFRDAQNYLRKYDDGFYDEPEYYAAFVLLDAVYII